MNRIEPSIWVHLSTTARTGDRLAARLAFPNVTARLLCAVDANNHRHLLVILESTDDELRDSKSRGLSVAARHLVIQGPGTPARYLDIECQDPAGFAAFDIIGSELAAELAKGENSPREIVERSLARWRRFWGELPKNLLTREQFLGLFGELWFLAFWLIPSVGPSEAILRWRGPFGARHDFEWQGMSIEVKTTVSTRGRVHRISGLEQLRAPEKGELLFFSLRLREEASAANTFSNLIEICRKLLLDDPDSLSMFEIGLARVGYSPMHNDEYSKTFLRIAEEALFAVRDDFPSITEQHLSSGVPPGVESVHYEINLNTFDHLRVATSSDKAHALFIRGT